MWGLVNPHEPDNTIAFLTSKDETIELDQKKLPNWAINIIKNSVLSGAIEADGLVWEERQSTEASTKTTKKTSKKASKKKATKKTTKKITKNGAK